MEHLPYVVSTEDIITNKHMTYIKFFSDICILTNCIRITIGVLKILKSLMPTPGQ